LSRTSERQVEKELKDLITEVSSIMRSGSDPLAVQLEPRLSKLRQLIKKSLQFKHIELDVEALYNLAILVYSQSKFLKDKSSILYVDPFLIRLAVMGSSTERLAEVFLQSWKPSTGRDVLSLEMMRRSYEYWNNLKDYSIGAEKTEPLLGESLESLGVTYDELISEGMSELHDELRNRGGRLLYEELLGEGSLNERLRRAVLISFMLSYGYATVEKEPLKRRFWIVARERASKEQPAGAESIVTIVS